MDVDLQIFPGGGYRERGLELFLENWNLPKYRVQSMVREGLTLFDNRNLPKKLETDYHKNISKKQSCKTCL